MPESLPEGSEKPSAHEAPRTGDAPNRATPAEISDMMARNLRMRTKRVPRAVRRNYFLYLLFYEGFFRWAVAAGVVCVLIVVALVPRIWITSPEGYIPVRKVRGLDIIQGASFRRAAVKEAEAGRLEESIQKWRAALAADPANVDAVKGFLKALSIQPVPDHELLPQGAYEASELMRLAGTNETTITAASEFYLRYNQYEWLMERLDNPTAPKNLTATRCLIAALFFNDQFGRLGALFKERAALVENDQESQLYKRAFLTVTGTTVESKAARAELETAATDPKRQVSALRILLFLDQKELRINEFEKHLQALEALKKARFHDRFVHLLLLKSLGRSKDAEDLARTALGAPDSPNEAAQLLQVWSEFQMYPEAAKFAREQLLRFRYTPTIWIQLGQILVDGKAWDELRAIGIQLRGIELVRPVLGNYGWYLEGVGLRGQRRDEAAEDAFQRFVAQPTVSEGANFNSATTMARLGYSALGLNLLKTMAGSTNAGTVFWKQYLLTAFEARNAKELLVAAKKLYDTDRSDREAMNDYAAALLTLRQEPQEALRLTFDLIQRSPGSINYQINHAQSLVQNRRTDEARSMLRSIPRASLVSAQLIQYDLTQIEVYLQNGKVAEAQSLAKNLDRTFLFPEQLEWLKTAVEGAPKK